MTEERPAEPESTADASTADVPKANAGTPTTDGPAAGPRDGSKDGPRDRSPDATTDATTDVPAGAHRPRRGRPASVRPAAPSTAGDTTATLTVTADEPGPVKATSGRATPDKATPSGATPGKATPSKATPGKAAPGKAAPGKAEKAAAGGKASAKTATKAAAGTTTEVLSDRKDGTSAAEKADRPPADWEHFAPAPPPVPGPLSKVAARTSPLKRVLGHEWTLAGLAALTLAVLLNWAALTDPAHTLPQDVWDPSLVAYLIAWGGFALLHDPAHLWHLNAFYPSTYGLAYSDSLLGYAPLGAIGTGPEAALVRYNLIFIVAEALVIVGSYALVRQLGSGRIGAAVAGVAMAVAPWRLAHAGHLHVLSTGGIVLALAMLARGHGVRWRPSESPSPKRPGWIIAGWLVATWQMTIGFGVGLVFAYVLLGVVIVSALIWGVRRRALPSLRVLLADLGGGLIFAAVTVLMALPYLRVLDLVPGARRTDAWIEIYSPTWRSYLTAPPESVIWGDLHKTALAQFRVPGEMVLLPGFALYAFAVAGLFFSVWSIRVRLLLLAGVVITMILGVGTNGPLAGRAGYLLLLHNLPGFEGLRTPGRLILWTTLLLALLAAGSVCALVARAMDTAQNRGLPRPTPAAKAALLIPLVLVLVEGLGATPHAEMPAKPAALATVEAPYLVLPSDELRDQHVMLWSTDGFPDIVNGGSGVTPPEQARTREIVQSFPDPASVDYLRKLGVRTVVILNALATGTPWEQAGQQPVEALGITVDETDEATIFHLRP